MVCILIDELYIYELYRMLISTMVNMLKLCDNIRIKHSWVSQEYICFFLHLILYTLIAELVCCCEVGKFVLFIDDIIVVDDWLN